MGITMLDFEWSRCQLPDFLRHEVISLDVAVRCAKVYIEGLWMHLG